MNSQSPQLLVVGSVAIDWIITPRAERKESVGGSATFFAMAASYLAQVRLVGVVGGDFPPAAVADLRAAGVDTSGLEVIEDGLTFRWKGQLPREHERPDDARDAPQRASRASSPKPAAWLPRERVPLPGQHPAAAAAPGVRAMKSARASVGIDTMNLWIDDRPRRPAERAAPTSTCSRSTTRRRGS
jgi:hypothetical protein